MKLRLKKCKVMHLPKSNPNFIFTTMESEQTITSEESDFRIKRETLLRDFYSIGNQWQSKRDEMLEITR